MNQTNETMTGYKFRVRGRVSGRWRLFYEGYDRELAYKVRDDVAQDVHDVRLSWVVDVPLVDSGPDCG